jgi:hypothetical protein
MFQLGSYEKSGFGAESFDFLPERSDCALALGPEKDPEHSSYAQAQECRYPTSFPFVD